MKLNKALEYDKFGDTYRLKTEVLYMSSKHEIKDYDMSPNLINIAMLLSDNTIHVID